jgi:hypothetical protein
LHVWVRIRAIQSAFQVQMLTVAAVPALVIDSRQQVVKSDNELCAAARTLD